MKLWQVAQSAPAWAALSPLKKNPKLAYRLLKYNKKVAAEVEAINAQRTALIYEAACVQPPPQGEQLLVQLGANTPQLAAFRAKYTEFLEGDCDLEIIGITMDDLIEGLGAESNVLSESDLALIEPFFMQPAPTATAAAEPAAVPAS